MASEYDELLERADGFDWQCENGNHVARELMQAIERLLSERDAARKKAFEDAASLVSSITTEMTASEVAEAIRRLA